MGLNKITIFFLGEIKAGGFQSFSDAAKINGYSLAGFNGITGYRRPELRSGQRKVMPVAHTVTSLKSLMAVAALFIAGLGSDSSTRVGLP